MIGCAHVLPCRSGYGMTLWMCNRRKVSTLMPACLHTLLHALFLSGPTP